MTTARFHFCRIALASALAAVCTVAAQAADVFPLAVRTTALDGRQQMTEYPAQPKAEQAWPICVSFPHMKDPFFVAADYGVIEEAKRLGVKVQVLDAGGYTQLSQQISQINNCVAGGAKAVVMVAISREGMNNVLAALKSKKVVVVDAINGVTSNDVGARVLSSPYDEGLHTGQYLAKLHPAGSTPARVGWLPGPAGAGFVNAFNAGFAKGIEGSAVTIAETKNGDVGKEVQARLVENLLQTHSNLDYIVGTAVTVEAAVPILKARKLEGKIKLVSLYLTPLTLQGLKNGTVEAAHVSPVVSTARLAIDVAVQLLQAKSPPPLVQYDTIGRVYSGKDIGALDVGTVLAPADFKPVFRYGK